MYFRLRWYLIRNQFELGKNVIAYFKNLREVQWIPAHLLRFNKDV